MTWRCEVGPLGFSARRLLFSSPDLTNNAEAMVSGVCPPRTVLLDGSHGPPPWHEAGLSPEVPRPSDPRRPGNPVDGPTRLPHANTLPPSLSRIPWPPASPGGWPSFFP